MANDKILQILINAKDETAKAFNSLAGRLEKAEGYSRTFALGLAAAGGGAVFLGKGMLEAAGNFEQSRIAFSTMLGSIEKADKLLRELTDFAKKTPFELRGLEEQAKKLLAYGIEQDKIIDTTRMLGDIAAGVGMDKLPNLTLAFGQVMAATRLTGMELRQFTEAGVPMLDELAKVMGKSVKEVQELVTKGEVGFPIVQQALQNLTGEGGRFEDMMVKQSKSLGGMVSNLRDAWDIFLRNEGAALLDWGKQFTAWVIHLVQNVLPEVIMTIKEVTQWFDENKIAIVMIAGAIVGALLPAIYAMIAAFAAGAIALAPFMIGGAIISGLVYGIISIAKNWEQTKDSIKFIWEVIKEIWGKATDWIKEKINNLIGWFENLINKIRDAMSWFDKFSLKNIGTAFGNLPANLGFGGGKAIGGPVNAGSGYIVGERGPEWFVPSSSGQIIPNHKIGGRQIVINITGNTLLDEYAAEKIGNLIINKLGMTEKYAL